MEKGRGRAGNFMQRKVLRKDWSRGSEDIIIKCKGKGRKENLKKSSAWEKAKIKKRKNMEINNVE